MALSSSSRSSVRDRLQNRRYRASSLAGTGLPGLSIVPHPVGVEYYAFHDIDIAPEGATLLETEKILHGLFLPR